MLCCEFQAERLATYSCPASEPGSACPAEASCRAHAKVEILPSKKNVEVVV